jgi:hypothetical protein
MCEGAPTRPRSAGLPESAPLAQQLLDLSHLQAPIRFATPLLLLLLWFSLTRGLVANFFTTAVQPARQSFQW